MRALIISDIHSNLEALEAVLAGAPAHDVVWNLGDTVGYAANPNEVIDRCRASRASASAATTTAPASAPADQEDFSPIADRAVQWTAKRFDPRASELAEEAAGRSALAGRRGSELRARLSRRRRRIPGLPRRCGARLPGRPRAHHVFRAHPHADGLCQRRRETRSRWRRSTAPMMSRRIRASAAARDSITC